VIKLSFDGIDNMEVDGQGNLELASAAGNLHLRKPLIYQVENGRRQPVAGGYLIHGQEISFAIGSYDESKPLVIDPVLAYSTLVGTESGGDGIAVDAEGNAYIVGTTGAVDFPTTPGAFQEKSPITCTPHEGCGGSAFVAKLNPGGTDLVYSTYLGGSRLDFGDAIFVDSMGNAYVAGTTHSGDFPVTAGAIQSGCGPCVALSAFVTVLNASGSGLIYSTYLGSRSGFQGDRTFVSSITADVAGFAYVTGSTDADDFPTTPGAFQTTYGGGFGGDAFVTKLDVEGLLGTGSALVYSTYLGGSKADSGHGIAVDEAGNAYVAGGTGSNDFPVTQGALQTEYGGGGENNLEGDAFVVKLDPTGTRMLYGTYLGGKDTDNAGGIKTDTQGNAYVAGITRSLDFPVTSGTFQTTYGGDPSDIFSLNAFVSKLDPTGSRLIFSTYLGGSGDDGGGAIALDSSGNIWLTATTDSPDFPTTEDALQPTYTGGTCSFGTRCRQVYISELSPEGSRLIYSTYLGGTDQNGASGIAIDRNGNIFVTGGTKSFDFPTSDDAFQSSCFFIDRFGNPSCQSAFVVKFVVGDIANPREKSPRKKNHFFKDHVLGERESH
jgi:hypothetical protein